MRLRISRAAVAIVLAAAAASGAHAANLTDTRAARVRIDDLNLQSRAGQDTLSTRLRRAASFVCDEPAGGGAQRFEVKRCMRDAVKRAARDIEARRS
jgi:UrcA family protein